MASQMRMTLKILAAGLVAGVLLSCPVPAGPARAAMPGCGIMPEAIITLRPPFYGSPSIWDGTYQVTDSVVQFSASVPLDNKNLLISGELLGRDYKPTEHFLIEMNSRARIVSEHRYPARSGERSTGLLKTDTGVVVSSNIFGGKRDTEKWTRLAWYDGERKYLRDMILKDPVFDYESMGIATAAGGRGFIAVVHAVNRSDPSDQHGMIFRISDSGKKLWERAYRPGIPNEIYGVSQTGERSYIATGRIRHEDGRMAGWILKLNDDGTIVWQNTYARGDSAMFRQGYTKPMGAVAGDHYVVTGQVMPIGGGPGAAWVMEVSQTGATVWQRYLRANDYALDGRAVQAYGDGRISVLMNAEAAETGEGQQGHIRLLTLSPRGQVMDDESYLEGQMSKASQMNIGIGEPWNGERIVTASIERSSRSMTTEGSVELITEAIIRHEKEKKMAESEGQFGPPPLTPEQAAIIAQSVPEEIYHQGWVFIATALDPYHDPCIPKQGHVDD